ncbi:MAG: TspO/MBR family protein [Hyphomicrobium sp.]
MSNTVAVAGLAAAAVMFVNGLATMNGQWAGVLNRPSWHPPGWLFGPVWSLLFVSIAAAAVIAWSGAANGTVRRRVLQLFAVNAFLNAFWSPLFFTARRPDWAAVELVLLWISTLLLVVYLWRRVRRSSVLLLPYLAWVTIAFGLNVEIVRLNAPFGDLSDRAASAAAGTTTAKA